MQLAPFIRRQRSRPESVEARLGPAATAAETKQGTLTLLERTYGKDGQRISTSFVNGVLIAFVVN